MQCMKCDEGELKKILFIKTGQKAFVCDYCDTYWLEGEQIAYNTGHALDPYHPEDMSEYSAQELGETDADHQVVRNVRRI